MHVDKEELRSQLLAQVRADLEALIRTQDDAHKGATHSENRAEHAKDTRATEQSYLARGLAERVEALRETETRLAQLELPAFDPDDPIAPCAVVRVRENAAAEVCCWWLLPVAGGLSITQGSETIRTLTPASPLGRALAGLGRDESGSFRTPRGEKHFTVLDVR